MGAGVVEFHVGVRHAHAVVAGGFGRSLRLRGEQHGVAPITKSVALCSVSGMSWATLGHAPLAGDRIVARVFVQRAVEQAEQGWFAGTVASDQTDLSPGLG